MAKLNWKFIVITALLAAFISVLSGLIGGVGVSSVLIRLVLVAILFSLLGAAINFVALTFLSNGESSSVETPSASSGESEGNRVNIVLEDENSGAADVIDEPESDSSTGEIEYNSTGHEKENNLGERSLKVDSDMTTSFDIDTLPDLGAFSSAFSQEEHEEEKSTDSGEESGYNENASFSSGGRLSSQGIAGTIAEQNSPEDIAKAVKTVMKREET